MAEELEELRQQLAEMEVLCVEQQVLVNRLTTENIRLLKQLS